MMQKHGEILEGLKMVKESKGKLDPSITYDKKTDDDDNLVRIITAPTSGSKRVIKINQEDWDSVLAYLKGGAGKVTINSDGLKYQVTARGINVIFTPDRGEEIRIPEKDLRYFFI